MSTKYRPEGDETRLKAIEERKRKSYKQKPSDEASNVDESKVEVGDSDGEDVGPGEILEEEVIKEKHSFRRLVKEELPSSCGLKFKNIRRVVVKFVVLRCKSEVFPGVITRYDNKQLKFLP